MSEPPLAEPLLAPRTSKGIIEEGEIWRIQTPAWRFSYRLVFPFVAFATSVGAAILLKWKVYPSDYLLWPDFLPVAVASIFWITVLSMALKCHKRGYYSRAVVHDSSSFGDLGDDGLPEEDNDGFHMVHFAEKPRQNYLYSFTSSVYDVFFRRQLFTTVFHQMTQDGMQLMCVLVAVTLMALTFPLYAMAVEQCNQDNTVTMVNTTYEPLECIHAPYVSHFATDGMACNFCVETLFVLLRDTGVVCVAVAVVILFCLSMVPKSNAQSEYDKAMAQLKEHGETAFAMLEDAVKGAWRKFTARPRKHYKFAAWSFIAVTGFFLLCAHNATLPFSPPTDRVYSDFVGNPFFYIILAMCYAMMVLSIVPLLWIFHVQAVTIVKYCTTSRTHFARMLDDEHMDREDAAVNFNSDLRWPEQAEVLVTEEDVRQFFEVRRVYLSNWLAARRCSVIVDVNFQLKSLRSVLLTILLLVVFLSLKALITLIEQGWSYETLLDPTMVTFSVVLVYLLSTTLHLVYILTSLLKQTDREQDLLRRHHHDCAFRVSGYAVLRCDKQLAQVVDDEASTFMELLEGARISLDDFQPGPMIFGFQLRFRHLTLVAMLAVTQLASLAIALL